jgi:predicted transposase YdaD
MKYVTTIERMAKRDARLATQTEIALNMLHENMALETIAEVTGLSIEQIQALQVQGNQETEPKG